MHRSLQNPQLARRGGFPAGFVRVEKHVIGCLSNEGKISILHLRHHYLTTRMCRRRFTPLTNGFSKKAFNHECALGVHFMYYNFARIHKILRVTPAMKAGIKNHVWALAQIAHLTR